MTSFAIRCADVTAEESGDLTTSPEFIQLVGESIPGATVVYLPPHRVLLLCSRATVPVIPAFLRGTHRVHVCRGRRAAEHAAARLCAAGVRTLYVLPRDAGSCGDATDDPFCRFLQIMRGRVNLVDDGGALRSHLIASRVCKSSGEIAQVEKACDCTAVGFRAVWRQLRTAKTTGALMAAIRAQQHDGMSYDPILMVGESIALRDLHASFEPEDLGDGAQSQRFVLLDLGYRCGHYCSDVTRTFPASGAFTPLQRTWYGIVLDAYLFAEANATAGTLFHELEHRTRRFLYDAIRDRTPLLEASAREEDWERVMSALMTHGLGHSVGLNVHDTTPLPWRLANDHVFAIEPGVYFDPGKLAAIRGVSVPSLHDCAKMGGIRIENTLVMRRGRAMRLSQLPLEPAAIERAISSTMRVAKREP